MNRIVMFLNRLRIKLGIASITVKVILGVSLILITAMGLFTYYDLATRTRFHFADQEERAYEISDTVMRSIGYAMLDGEMQAVQGILERLNALHNIEVVNLTDTAGRIKYSGSTASIGVADDSEAARGALSSTSIFRGVEVKGEEKLFYHAMPVANEKGCHKCHGSERKVLGILTVGINWGEIEERSAAIRDKEITLAVLSVIVVGFFLSLFLTKYVTQPLSTLTRLADDISRGRPGFEFGRTIKCWEVAGCDKTKCPAYGNTEVMCWYVDGTHCELQPSGQFPDKLDKCRKCLVYRSHVGDEMVRLADSFKHMLHRVRIFEKELMASEKKYRLLYDTDPNPIFILDRETLEILDANARAVTHYGHSKEELSKMTFADLGYEQDATEVMAHFKEVMDQRSILFSKRQHRKKDGTIFYANVHVSGAPYMGRDVLIAAATDVTEGVEKEAQLIQASKLATLGEMAAGIAHELNQPLNVMKVGSDFIKKMVDRQRKLTDEELRTVADQISSQVDRASGIINHLREFVRVSDIKTELLDINKPIRDTFKILGEQLKLRQIELILDLDKNLPLIVGHSNRLEQVFINLVTNARNALEDKKPGLPRSLTINSFLDDSDVVVTVSDTGEGIPKEIIGRIFEPFFTTKEVGKGSGLGLSISYGIVKDYGGAIKVKSEVGMGTVFEVRFPASAQPLPTASDRKTTGDHANV